MTASITPSGDTTTTQVATVDQRINPSPPMNLDGTPMSISGPDHVYATADDIELVMKTFGVPAEQTEQGELTNVEAPTEGESAVQGEQSTEVEQQSGEEQSVEGRCRRLMGTRGVKPIRPAPRSGIRK